MKLRYEQETAPAPYLFDFGRGLIVVQCQLDVFHSHVAEITTNVVAAAAAAADSSKGWLMAVPAHRIKTPNILYANCCGCCV